MTIHPLFEEEAAYRAGATHRVVVTYTDLVALAGGTGAQAIALLTAKAGTAMNVNYTRTVTPFTSSDATLLSIAGTIGDAGSVNRLSTSQEFLTPPVPSVQGGVALNPVLYAYTTDTAVNLTLTPTGGKNLNTATAGELHIYLNIQPPSPA